GEDVVDEDAVELVGRKGWLAGDGDDPLPVLPQALGDQLLEPARKRGEAGGRAKGEFVVTVGGVGGPAQAEGDGGVFGRRPPGDVVGEGGGAPQEGTQIDTHDGGWHQTKGGEGGIAAANVRRRQDGGPKAAFFGHLGQRRTRVGDGDEAGAVAARALPEVAEEGQGLQGGSRLGGDDEGRPFQVDHARLLLHG